MRHAISFASPGQMHRDRRTIIAPQERVKNFVQKCLFSKKYLEACKSSDTKHTSIPKALQLILRELDRDSDLMQSSESKSHF